MKVLALESSAKAVSVAVCENGVILAQGYQNTGLTHSVTMMPLLENLMKTASLSLADMDVIAVAAGPGSFTGLRIGVSAAKGLAWSLEKPCCGVSTLEAMAENGRSFEGTVICAMDARRQQIYNAIFDCRSGELTRRCDDRAVALAQVAEELQSDPAPKLVIGDGAQLCCDYLTAQGIQCRVAPPALRFQQAAGVALVAERMALAGKTVSAQELSPTYLRLSQAERERLEKGLPLTAETK